MSRLLLFFLLFLLGTGSGTGKSISAQDKILVFAAASMKEALEEIGSKFSVQCNCQITFSFAGSGALARQIRAGAKADLFISADEAWVEWLVKHQIIDENTIRRIAGNNLVIAAGNSVSQTVRLPVKTVEELATVLKDKRIAMSDVISVPAGRYGRQALEQLALWDKLRPALVFGENVRVTLRMVARGDVDAAIVYKSDTLVEPAVHILYRFETNLHQHIVYPAVLINNHETAREFHRFLTTDTAMNILARLGFTVPADG